MTMREPVRSDQRGMISPAEAIMLAVMTAIVVAIAIPSYSAMRERSDNAAARTHARQAADAVEAAQAERGSYLGVRHSLLSRFDSSLSPTSYRLVWADRSGYCVQSTSGGRTWHVEGPSGELARGGCP